MVSTIRRRHRDPWWRHSLLAMSDPWVILAEIIEAAKELNEKIELPLPALQLRVPTEAAVLWTSATQ